MTQMVTAVAAVSGEIRRRKADPPAFPSPFTRHPSPVTRHLSTVTLPFLFCLILLVLAPAALRAADDFLFSGPSPARNFQPIQFIFLHFPFERAATVGDGVLGFNVESAEANVIATSQGVVESTLKFETNRTVFGLRYGLAPHWEVGLDVPFISRFGGALDPFIDEVEYIFDAGNRERDIYPNNSFGDFTVKKGDVTLFDGEKTTFALGDLWTSLKYDFAPLPDWPLLVAVRAAIKAPSGRESNVTGSGSPDFGLGLAADYRVFSRLMTYLNMNVVFPVGPITPAQLSLHPIFSQSFAAELALTKHLSALLHQAVYTSPMHGNHTRLLDGEPVEIGLGLNCAWSEALLFQFLAIDNVSPVEPAADFTVMLSMKTRIEL